MNPPDPDDDILAAWLMERDVADDALRRLVARGRRDPAFAAGLAHLARLDAALHRDLGQAHRDLPARVMAAIDGPAEASAFVDRVCAVTRTEETLKTSRISWWPVAVAASLVATFLAGTVWFAPRPGHDHTAHSGQAITITTPTTIRLDEHTGLEVAAGARLTRRDGVVTLLTGQARIHCERRDHPIALGTPHGVTTFTGQDFLMRIDPEQGDRAQNLDRDRPGLAQPLAGQSTISFAEGSMRSLMGTRERCLSVAVIRL